MHPGPPLIACGRGVRGGLRVPTSDPHTINACWSLFLLSVYLLVAEAASFDKKELCRSDTGSLAWPGTKKIAKKYLKKAKIVNLEGKMSKFSNKSVFKADQWAGIHYNLFNFKSWSKSEHFTGF